MQPPPEHADVDVLLAEAAAAADEGRALAELDRLNALLDAGRLAPDPRLDRALVALRHAAFAELDRRPGRPTWPPAYADPFPQERGIPSAALHALSAAVLGGALTHHGCLRVDGLLAPEQAEAFRRLIDDAFAAREQAEADGAADHVGPAFVPFEVGRAKAQGFGADGYVRAVDSPGALRELAAAFARTGVTAVVAEYLGERPSMIANKWVLRRSPTGKIGTDYHQDGAFLGEGIRTVDCWISLSHCGPGTGRPAIDLVARRFPGIIPSPDDAAFPWSLTEAAVRDAAPDAPVLSPVFAPGDAIFFDELLPHRTTVGLDLT
ncbi:MAG: hypothetical protein R2746_16345, partial [Acidimicrobiales bacterium]